MQKIITKFLFTFFKTSYLRSSIQINDTIAWLNKTTSVCQRWLLYQAGIVFILMVKHLLYNSIQIFNIVKPQRSLYSRSKNGNWNSFNLKWYCNFFNIAEKLIQIIEYSSRLKWHSPVGPGLSFLFVLRDEMPQRCYQIPSRLACYGTIHEL